MLAMFFSMQVYLKFCDRLKDLNVKINLVALGALRSVLPILIGRFSLAQPYQISASPLIVSSPVVNMNQLLDRCGDLFSVTGLME